LDEADVLLDRDAPEVVMVNAAIWESNWGALRRLSRAGSVFVINASASVPSAVPSSPESSRTRHPSDGVAREAVSAAARGSVGRLGVKEAQKALRAEMFREALRQAKGNRHAAARVLRCDRRYVLKMLQEDPELEASPQRGGAPDSH
jgi:DNA-binding NtrC family response regulator